MLRWSRLLVAMGAKRSSPLLHSGAASAIAVARLSSPAGAAGIDWEASIRELNDEIESFVGKLDAEVDGISSLSESRASTARDSERDQGSDSHALPAALRWSASPPLTAPAPTPAPTAPASAVSVSVPTPTLQSLPLPIAEAKDILVVHTLPSGAQTAWFEAELTPLRERFAASTIDVHATGSGLNMDSLLSVLLSRRFDAAIVVLGSGVSDLSLLLKLLALANRSLPVTLVVPSIAHMAEVLAKKDTLELASAFKVIAGFESERGLALALEDAHGPKLPI